MNVVRTQSNRQMFISQTLRLWKSLKNKAWLTKIQNLLQLTPMHALVLPWSRRVRERRRSRSQIIVRPLRIAVSCKKWRVLTSLMVAQVAKYCEIPQPAHWNAIIKRILLLAYTYFVPKRNLWLRILVRGRYEGAIGYTDADGDLDDCKSTLTNFLLQEWTDYQDVPHHYLFWS